VGVRFQRFRPDRRVAQDAVSVEHVAAALGQKGPRVTRRSYLAPGAEQSSRARKVEQLIAGAAGCGLSAG
jgi:hypothetical protein